MSQRFETFRFLADSPHRFEILRVLRDEKGLSRSELASSVDASRRTVKRALDAFRERGWITENDGALSLSVGGAFVLDAYEDFADRAALVDDLQPFFARVATQDCLAGPDAFEGATVVEMDPAYPFATVEYLLDQYHEATERAFVLLTYVSIGILEEIAEDARDREVGLTVVIDATIQRATEDNEAYRDLFANAEIADIYAIDESYPFSLTLVDDHAIVTVADDHGLPSVLLGSSNPEFVTLTERLIRGAYMRAEPFEPGEPKPIDNP